MSAPERQATESRLNAPASGWVLYLLACRGNRLYAGITNDLPARLRAHQSGKGAKFTRAYPPVGLVACQPHPDRSSASKAEWAVKQLPRSQKIAFVQSAKD